MRPAAAGSAADDHDWTRLADAAAIAAVVGLLLAIHVIVPPGIREEFALSYASPDPFHALTAAFVHVNDAHLYQNLAGYLLGSGLALALSVASDERRWFRLTMLAYLTLLPIAVGMTAALTIDRAVVSRGFSSVVAGYAGFVLVATGVVLHRSLGFDRWLAYDIVAVMSIVLAGEIIWVVTETVSLAATGLLTAGFGLTLVPLIRAGLRSGWPEGPSARARFASAAVVVVGLLLVVSWFVSGLFPTDLAGEDGVTNVLAHYLGLVYGAIIAVWGYRFWSTAPG